MEKFLKHFQKKKKEKNEIFIGKMEQMTTSKRKFKKIEINEKNTHLTA